MLYSRLTGLKNYRDLCLVYWYPKIKQGIMGNEFVTYTGYMLYSQLTGLKNYRDLRLVDWYPKIKQAIMDNNFVT